MLTRMAIFNGTVKAGQNERMQEWVQRHLAPLWRKFDQAHDVKVMFGVQQDPDGPLIPLVLAITYADETAMAAGLASDARYASRYMLPAFYDAFFDDVTLWHYVLDETPAN